MNTNIMTQKTTDYDAVQLCLWVEKKQVSLINMWTSKDGQNYPRMAKHKNKSGSYDHDDKPRPISVPLGSIQRAKEFLAAAFAALEDFEASQNAAGESADIPY